MRFKQLKFVWYISFWKAQVCNNSLIKMQQIWLLAMTKQNEIWLNIQKWYKKPLKEAVNKHKSREKVFKNNREVCSTIIGQRRDNLVHKLSKSTIFKKGSIIIAIAIAKELAKRYLVLEKYLPAFGKSWVLSHFRRIGFLER